MKPAELAQAQMVSALAEKYGALPWPGSLLEQPAVAFLLMHSILALGASDAASPLPPETDLAGMMVPL